MTTAEPESGRPAAPEGASPRSAPEDTPPGVEPNGFAPPYPCGPSRFAPGDVVRVRPGRGPGHIRTPWYVRGRLGRLERRCGDFPNPEDLAYQRPGLAIPLWRVRFSMAELWGDRAENPRDTLDVEIYEHWLEPGDAP